MRTTPDGKGVVTCLELPSVQDKPVLFSTFLMWMLADLFTDLPEIGDPDKPKLMFFFDEAHLLFDDASKPFLDSIEQTVRLIRSKGVGVFFVTQTPKDVPCDVLAQLANRVQHALRAFTPDDAKALKATVSTFPTSGYDLGQLLTQLGTGEAVVTVLSERGRADAGGLDPDAGAPVADGAVAGRDGRRRDRRQPAATRSTPRRSTGSRRTRCSPPSWLRPRRRPLRGGPRHRPRPPGARPRRAGVPGGQAAGLHRRAGREVVGVQVADPLRRHRHRPGDHPQHLRGRRAPPEGSRRSRATSRRPFCRRPPGRAIAGGRGAAGRPGPPSGRLQVGFALVLSPVCRYDMDAMTATANWGSSTDFHAFTHGPTRRTAAAAFAAMALAAALVAGCSHGGSGHAVRRDEGRRCRRRWCRRPTTSPTTRRPARRCSMKDCAATTSGWTAGGTVTNSKDKPRDLHHRGVLHDQAVDGPGPGRDQGDASRPAPTKNWTTERQLRQDQGRPVASCAECPRAEPADPPGPSPGPVNGRRQTPPRQPWGRSSVGTRCVIPIRPTQDDYPE